MTNFICHIFVNFQANEQSRRFEGILKICKQVNPKIDVHNFIMSLTQEPIAYEPKIFSFNPPSDPNIPGSEVCKYILHLKRKIPSSNNHDK